MIAVGQTAVHEFVADAHAMNAFRKLSGDSGPIHCDPLFARERGYNGVLVYGGIMLAQLSYVLAMQLPGGRCIWTGSSIAYRGPLYVDERATLTLEISNVSLSTGLVDSKFRIEAAGRTVATGTAQSLMSLGDLAAATGRGARDV